MWWWVGAWTLLVIGGAWSLWLVIRNTWRSFALFANAAADAAETGAALGDRMGEALDLAKAAAAESHHPGITDPVAARRRVDELQAARAERREARHLKHLAKGQTWQLDTWLAERQARTGSS